MSSDEEDGFGGLFGDDTENNNNNEIAKTEEELYPIEHFILDRFENLKEGKTYSYFQPHHYHLNGFYNTENENYKNKNHEKNEIIDESEKEKFKLYKKDVTVYFRNKRHSLWGHRVWNAAKYLTKMMDQEYFSKKNEKNKHSFFISVAGKTVLELGAGLGVPAVLAYRNGAKNVIVTDYPDEDLLKMIRMNVEKNCQNENNDNIDLNVQEELFQRYAARKKMLNSENEKNNELSEEEKNKILGSHTIQVAPLLWGNKPQIENVLSLNQNKKFDIIFLSDILFNHVCNDDLADTVSQLLNNNFHANDNNNNENDNNHYGGGVAYCVFSHHRAHKQCNDLEFFDKLSQRGFIYEEVDREEYPMMFPEDRGPVSVREPVHVYVIQHRFSNFQYQNNKNKNKTVLNVIPPLPNQPFPSVLSKNNHNSNNHNNTVFDIAIQGTGLIESLLSAAFARAGLRVLQCEGGTVHQTSSFSHFANQYGNLWTSSFSFFEFNAYFLPRLEYVIHWMKKTGQKVVPPSPVILINKLKHLFENNNNNNNEIRKFVMDVMPTHFLSDGALIQTYAKQTDLASTMEFQNLSRLLFLKLNPNEKNENQYETHLFPFTRSEIFKTDLFSLMNKRRLMKFVKDVESQIVEDVHAKTSNTADQTSFQTEKEKNTEEIILKELETQIEQFINEENKNNNNNNNNEISLRNFLKKKYNLQDDVCLDVLTLMGELDLSQDENNERNHFIQNNEKNENNNNNIRMSIEKVRELLRSVPKYKIHHSENNSQNVLENNNAPFLVPTYGSSEIIQNLTRSSAVWGSTILLDRSIVGVTLQSSNINNNKNNPEPLQSVILSDGQTLSCRVVLTPRACFQNNNKNENNNNENHNILLPRLYVRDSQHLTLSEVDPSIFEHDNHKNNENENNNHKNKNIEYTRAVLILQKPLFTWEDVTKTSKNNNTNENNEFQLYPPSVTALLYWNNENNENHNQKLVYLTQQSALTEQAPVSFNHNNENSENNNNNNAENKESPVILHFTVETTEMENKADFYKNFEQFIFHQFFNTETKKESILYFSLFTISELLLSINTFLIQNETVTNNIRVHGFQTENEKNEKNVVFQDEDVLLHHNKHLLYSETIKSDVFGLEEWYSLANAKLREIQRIHGHKNKNNNENENKNEKKKLDVHERFPQGWDHALHDTDCCQMHKIENENKTELDDDEKEELTQIYQHYTFPVLLPKLLDDSEYVKTAEQLFHTIVRDHFREVVKTEFLEKIEIPSNP